MYVQMLGMEGKVMKKILVVCTDPERGKYKAIHLAPNETLAAEAFGEYAAILELLVKFPEYFGIYIENLGW